MGTRAHSVPAAGGRHGSGQAHPPHHPVAQHQPVHQRRPDMDPGQHLRFAYSYVDADRIREGIRLLGNAYKELTGG